MQWKQNRIRQALKAFKTFGANGYQPVSRALEGQGAYSWLGVAHEIAEVGGVELTSSQAKNFAERLRQFVEGSPDKARKRAQGRRGAGGKDDEMAQLSGWRLELVETFLLHSDPDDPVREKPLLSQDYLSEASIEIQAPLYMLSYLQQGSPARSYLGKSVMDGAYIAEQETTEGPCRYTMALTVQDPATPLDLAAITQVDLSEQPLASHDRDAPGSGPDDPAGAPIPYFGWAVVTPEDTILAFLRNARTRENHVLHSVTVDARIYDDEPMQTVTFFHNNVPTEIDAQVDAGTDAETKSETAELLASRLLTFRREQGG